MANQYVIGIDIGTSACKSLLVDQTGSILARALEPYPLSTPRPGWSEQDPEDWWQAVKKSVQHLLAQVRHVGEIRAIGLSGQMHGLVALDRETKVIRPCILWNDQRNEKQCQDIYDRVGGLEALLRLTNNRMLPGYTGGKVLWMRENERHLYDRIKRILNPKDYIRLRLTGEFATEVSDASGTGLFNVRQRKWSSELLHLLDIPPEWLPRCHESAEITGTVGKHVAEEIGLPSELPVVGGGGDAVIQTTGTGLVNPGNLGTTIGTAGIVGMALDSCPPNPEGKLQIFCNNMPGKWHAMGVTLTAGGALRWFRDNLGDAERERSRQSGEDVYELLTQEAARVPPGSEGLLFLPYFIGERCPHIDPHARGAFIGLTFRHTRGHLVRSLLEGVIFSLRTVAQVIEELGVSLNQIRTSGGGAASELWRQIHADVFNSEVVTVSGSNEGGAYGAAFVAGAGVGLWPTVEEAVKTLRVETRTRPITAHVERYRQLFEVYRGLYGALKPSFDQISKLL
jgi:xylulokinase